MDEIHDRPAPDPIDQVAEGASNQQARGETRPGRCRCPLRAEHEGQECTGESDDDGYRERPGADAEGDAPIGRQVQLDWPRELDRPALQRRDRPPFGELVDCSGAEGDQQQCNHRGVTRATAIRGALDALQWAPLHHVVAAGLHDRYIGLNPPRLDAQTPPLLQPAGRAPSRDRR